MIKTAFLISWYTETGVNNFHQTSTVMKTPFYIFPCTENAVPQHHNVSTTVKTGLWICLVSETGMNQLHRTSTVVKTFFYILAFRLESTQLLNIHSCCYTRLHYMLSCSFWGSTSTGLMARRKSSNPCSRMVSESALSVPHNGHFLVIPSSPINHVSRYVWQPTIALEHRANITGGAIGEHGDKCCTWKFQTASDTGLWEFLCACLSETDTACLGA